VAEPALHRVHSAVNVLIDAGRVSSLLHHVDGLVHLVTHTIDGLINRFLGSAQYAAERALEFAE
jgi:hypothetical protein